MPGMSGIFEHQLPNGLRLLAEPIAGAQSLAMAMLMPAGVSQEPQGQQGAATLLSEMLNRGAGELDARAHSDALDHLGVQRGTSVETAHIRLGATMIGRKSAQALPLLLDMVRRPMLAESALEPARDLALQSLDALEDEPQEKAMLVLRQRHYPMPFGRSPLGRREDLETITIADVRAFWKRTFVPGDAVLGFAGHFDWSQLKDQITQLLGDWQGTLPEAGESFAAPRGYQHVEASSTQVHIGIAYDAPREPDPQSILQRAATAVLSGGMSGRLFTEVREKRGLCYSVYATYAGSKHRGAVLSYVGTTVPRAQETLDVLTGELRRLSDGIEADEFARAIVGMKSRLVMQGESTNARAHAIAQDQYVFGRPRTLQERREQVDALTLDAVRQYVADHRPSTMTIVTIGPEALNTPSASPTDRN